MEGEEEEEILARSVCNFSLVPAPPSAAGFVRERELQGYLHYSKEQQGRRGRESGK